MSIPSFERADGLMRARVLQDVASESLRELLIDHASVDTTSEDVTTIPGWVCRFTQNPKDTDANFSFHGETEGRPFDYRFQRAIMEDPARYVCVRKSAQMGISEIMVRECLARLVLYPSTAAIYVLPTKPDVEDFSDSRLRRILEASPRLSQLVRHTNNQTRKQIGSSFLFIRGAWEYHLAQMIAADWLFMDEYDRLKPHVVPSFEKRLSGSSWKYKRAFGTPMLAGIGIDRLFQQSDRKFWFEACWKCGYEEVIGFEKRADGSYGEAFAKNVKKEEGESGYVYAYVCSHCGAHLPPERRSGRWQATAKSDLNLSGYHVSQFMSPTNTPEELAVTKATTTIVGDYLNLTLGLPAKAGMADEEMAYGVVGKHAANLALHSGGEALMAIDWGMPWSWAEVSLLVGDARHVMWIECFHAERISEHVARMQEVALQAGAGYIIADHGYGAAQNEEMRDFFKSKYWTIFTNTGEARADPGYDLAKHHVSWGKLRCVKTHFGLLRQKRIILPGESPIISYNTQIAKPAHALWIDHHQAIKIKPVAGEKREEMLYGAVALAEELTADGPVHLVACSMYADVMAAYVRRRAELEQSLHARPFRGAIVGGRH